MAVYGFILASIMYAALCLCEKQAKKEDKEAEVK